MTKLKAGDTFTENAMLQDRQAIYETGLFYDIYPSIEVVPEGVKLTYHVMENPVLKSVEIIGNKAYVNGKNQEPADGSYG